MVWNTRSAMVLAATLVGAAAFSTFDGPAAVAWRWAQSATLSPSGSPVVDGDSVYVAVGGRIYGLNRVTGNQLWRFPVAEPLESQFVSGASMGNGVVVAADDNRNIFAIDAKTGAVKWQFATPEGVLGTPVIAGSTVVAPLSNNSLIAIDAETGQARWDKPIAMPDGVFASLATWQENVIVLTRQPAVVSMNAASGRINWTARVSRLSATASAAVYGDAVFVNSGNFISAIRIGTGGRKWEQRVDEDLVFGPAASELGVVSVSRTGKVFVLDLNGRFVLRQGVTVDSVPVAQPSFVGSTLVVGTSNGLINVLDPKSGDVVFNYLVPPLFKTARTADGGSQAQMTVPIAGPATVSGDTMLVLARDGSLLAFDKNIGVDLTPPSVTMLWPNPGDQVAGKPPMEMAFMLSDASSGVRPDSVKIMIDSTEYAGRYQRDGLLTLAISSGGPNQPLMDGRREITVIAKDWLGNETQRKFVLLVDNTLPALGGLPRRDGADAGGGGGRGGGRRGGL
ncbi:MAG: PQQ-binding-like beta-propeller repeat protein [Fimbriimonadaceae bacterium]|nr:PQQ-binding-like beta-propeller repeat protein [Fimbriimonadaceae bacterium]QYK58383.1 MAG: PQQ-binding-like beta-propeller repeat protein [Fimbriimonadaceae bacterium]